MTNFLLKFIAGAAEISIAELKTKLPEVTIVNKGKDFVEVASANTDVDQFRVLHTFRHASTVGQERALDKPLWRTEFVPAGLNPALAAVMCNLAKLEPSARVIDPCCGGGTIAVTAAKEFGTKVFASDKSSKAVLITTNNAKRAGLKKHQFTCVNIRLEQLRLQSGSFDAVITNLPFGVRTGDHSLNIDLYKQFAEKAKGWLKPGGRLVALTQDKQLLAEQLTKAGFKIIVEHEVKAGGMQPSIFVCER